MARFNWGFRDMDRAINIVRKLEKEYSIEADHIGGLYEILFDAKKFDFSKYIPGGDE